MLSMGPLVLTEVFVFSGMIILSWVRRLLEILRSRWHDFIHAASFRMIPRWVLEDLSPVRKGSVCMEQ